jgi:hypothetical protein
MIACLSRTEWDAGSPPQFTAVLSASPGFIGKGEERLTVCCWFGPGLASYSAAALRMREETTSDAIMPSRMWTTRWAYSAMSGSWVTSTMVFPPS